ncbi:YybH family protein [Sandaracinobacteroides hominis]|uniref:YybH family protein n=1 Tax=Sandaracinobacteroides hominis TaxID=2780086 RepID=UPI0018F48C51|nr:nuclear transport factor 2 family protein [Sandaracinobacteroides hominis]
MTATTLEEAIALNQRALDTMLKGSGQGYAALLSDRDDVSWGNPFGPFAVGREQVEAALARAAANFREGAATDFERVAAYVADNLAVIVEVERGHVKFGGADDSSPAALRVTTVFRLEGEDWKVVHRHADPVPPQA